MPAYKDKNVKWYASLYASDWTGKRGRQFKRGFNTKREAQEYERKFLCRQTGDLGMTFGTFVDLYKEDLEGRLKEHTWVMKNHLLDKKILPYFKDKKMNEIKFQMLSHGRTQ